MRVKLRGRRASLIVPGGAIRMAPEPVAGYVRRASHVFELQTLLYVIVLLLIVSLALFPVLLLILFSFSAGAPGAPFQFSLAAWPRAFADPSIVGSVFNTIKLLVAVHTISLPVAIGIAWVLARTDLPGRHGFEFMFWISFFMPTLAILLGWIMCLDPEFGVFNVFLDAIPFIHVKPFNIYTFWGVVWAHLMTHSITVKVMLLTPTFRNIDSAFEEAAQISGASRLATLTRVVIPVTMPAVLAILFLAVIYTVHSFEIELVLGPPFRFFVYSTQVYTLIQQEDPDFAAASVLATVALSFLLPLIFLQRWVSVRRQYTTISGKMSTAPMRLGVWRIPALVVMTIVVVTLTALPVVFLVLASFMKLFGFFDIPQPWTLNHWTTILSDTVFRASVVNTFALAAGAAIFATVFLSLVAYFSVRSTFKGRAILDVTSWLPLAVPGILFGLGLIYVFLGIPLFRPLYGTMWLMIIAVVITHMALGTQIFKATLLQLSQDIEEASMMVGASWIATFKSIVLPIIVPTVLLVATITFISAARDVASVALVATTGTQTLALLQLNYMIQGRYGAAAVISFIVILMSTGLALVARRFGLRIGLRT
jgi:iron(III) transport system permease protein